MLLTQLNSRRRQVRSTLWFPSSRLGSSLLPLLLDATTTLLAPLFPGTLFRYPNVLRSL